MAFTDSPTGIHTVGRTDSHTLACACGAEFTIGSRREPSPFNPALATSTVSMADFRAQRDWLGTHRAHGAIAQVH